MGVSPSALLRCILQSIPGAVREERRIQTGWSLYLQLGADTDELCVISGPACVNGVASAQGIWLQ